MSNYKQLVVRDRDGGAELIIPGVMQTDGTIIFGDSTINLSNTGLLLTTAGVADSLNKRFMTDAQETAFDAAVVTVVAGERLLGTTNLVDLNTGAATVLYTVTAGKKCVVTRVVIRKASTSLTTVKVSFGYNGPATYNDYAVDALYTELTGAALYTVVPPIAGAALGDATDDFCVMVNTVQGGAATCSIDVFGYEY